MNGIFGSPNAKYGFKVKYNQFGGIVESNYVDPTEVILVDIFQTKCESMLRKEKEHYKMVELGSNQAYYSLMFKAMCKFYSKTSEIICVEPNDRHMIRGKEHFFMNNLGASFCDFIIGDYATIKKDLDNSSLPGGSNFLLNTKKRIMTLEELLVYYKIDELDVLHMDVDFSECSVLFSSPDLFVQQKVKNIYISTHSKSLHNWCKDYLLNCGYRLDLQISKMIVGYDSLLVFSVD